MTNERAAIILRELEVLARTAADIVNANLVRPADGPADRRFDFILGGKYGIKCLTGESHLEPIDFPDDDERF